ncbi:MAG: hypothetical protein L3J67_11650, partial [Hyphomicrobiaceae bacterium]|nr:hypothetical protein [Hyphomicrobiaceae bacterium]
MVNGDRNPIDEGATTPPRGRPMVSRLVLFSGATGVLFYGVLSLVQPQYRSVAQIYIERGGEEPAIVVAKELKVLRSQQFKKTFIADTDLARDAEYNGVLAKKGPLSKVAMDLGVMTNPAKLSLENRIAGAFAQKIAIFKGREAGVIMIAVRSNEAAKAARFANQYASVYLDLVKARSAVFKSTERRAGHPIAERPVDEAVLAGLKKQVGRKTRDLQALRKDMVAHPFVPSSQGGLVVTGQSNRLRSNSPEPNSPLSAKLKLDKEQVFELTSQYILARADRKEAELRVRLVTDMLETAGGINSSALVLNKGAIGDLLAKRDRLDKRISALRVKLLPSHPQLKRLNRDRLALQNEVRLETKNVVARLQAEALLAAEREKTFKESLDNLNKGDAPREGASRAIEQRIVEKDPRIAKLAVLTSELVRKQRQLAAFLLPSGPSGNSD